MTRHIPGAEQPSKTRRDLLGLGAVAAGMMAGAALTPQPASAHGGDPNVLHLGHDNLAFNGTQLNSATEIPTLHVTNTHQGPALLGQSTAAAGVSGSTGALQLPNGPVAAGVHGVAHRAIGVIGHSFERVGVSGISDGQPLPDEPVAGVHGIAQHGVGVFGHSLERVGVNGITEGVPLFGQPVAGVHGVAPAAVGVIGSSALRVGVAGHSGGVPIAGEPVAGVFGAAPNAVGVLGVSQSGVAVQAVNPEGVALEVTGRAQFSDDIQCSGTISSPIIVAGTIAARTLNLPVHARVIPARTSAFALTDPSVGANDVVLFNLTSNPGLGVALSWIEIVDGGFVIHLTARTRRDTTFNYAVVG